MIFICNSLTVLNYLASCDMWPNSTDRHWISNWNLNELTWCKSVQIHLTLLNPYCQPCWKIFQQFSSSPVITYTIPRWMSHTLCACWRSWMRFPNAKLLCWKRLEENLHLFPQYHGCGTTPVVQYGSNSITAIL